MVIRSPADAMFGFGQPTDTFALPHLRSFLSKHGSIVIEADGLYQFPVFKEYEFIKGVVLTQAGEDMVDISDLLVELRGSHIVGWGESASRRPVLEPPGRRPRRAGLDAPRAGPTGR